MELDLFNTVIKIKKIASKIGKVLQYVQTHPQICRLKEGNNKLLLTFEKLKSVKRAKEILEGVGE